MKTKPPTLYEIDRVMHFNGCCFVCASEWLGIDPGEDYCICHETELLKESLASAKERIYNNKRYVCNQCHRVHYEHLTASKLCCSKNKKSN